MLDYNKIKPGHKFKLKGVEWEVKEPKKGSKGLWHIVQVDDLSNIATAGTRTIMRGEWAGAWVKDTFKELEKCYGEAKEPIVAGVSSGFKLIDQMTAGLGNGTLTVVGSRPSVGKTTVLVNIANYLSSRHNTLYISTNENQVSLTMRFYAMRMRKPIHEIRGGYMRDTDWPKIARAAGDLSQGLLDVICEPYAYITKLDELCEKYEASVLIVDSMNMIQTPMFNTREKEMSSIAQGLKRLALQRNIPVIAACSLSRSLESRVDRHPVLTDLRDSGCIEDCADNVLMLYRDDYYNPETDMKGLMEIIAAKSISQGTGFVKLFRDICLIEDYSA